MKKIRIPRRRRGRTYAEKFAKDAAFFGSGEKYTPTDYGSLPFLLLCMLGLTVLAATVLLLGKLPTLDCSRPGFPVLHHLPKLAQTQVR